MDIYEELARRKLLLKEWHNSPDYWEICAQKAQECERLRSTALQFYKNIQSIMCTAEENVARVETEVGGDIHRGVYCPSPVYDLIIGNVKRGRILKRVTTASKPSHQFGFSKDGKLLFSRFFYDGVPVKTEYILFQGDYVYGLTVDPEYGLTDFCEEYYENQQLLRYQYMNMFSVGNGQISSILHSEAYFYDVNGLKTCKWEEYETFANMLSIQFYNFEREDGFLSSYTFSEKPFMDHPSLVPQRIYRPGVKRKA